MRVYISSTYRDLQPYRQAVSLVLRRMGHQPIGMEEYVAEGMRPLHRCLADVQACDAYVGILAWRYGHVPTDAGAPNSVLPKGGQLGRTSITEFEFRQAIQSGKQLLMFVLDGDAQWPSVHFDAVSGDGQQGKAIMAFRTEVTQQYVVSYFRSPDELASLVSAGIYRLEMSRQMSLESLQIDVQFNDPIVRTGEMEMVDTTLWKIKGVITGPPQPQALKIDIGQGRDWWTTRLYFMATLADLASIDVMVFVEKDDAYRGIVNPRILTERLAQTYPLLSNYALALAQAGPQFSDLGMEVDRRASIWTSQMKAAGGETSISTFVTSAELERWLNPYWITQAIEWQPNESDAFKMQRLIDWPMRHVPVVEKGKFVRVVDKRALVEQVARIFVREQVSRTISTTR